MKTITKILITLIFLFASGAVGFLAYSQENDDVYYNPSREKAKKASTTEQTEISTQSPVDNENLLPASPDEAAVSNQETDGMTDYERYSLQKEKEFLSSGKTARAKADTTSPVNDTINQAEGLDEESPFYSEYEQTDDGKTIINNYYLSEDDEYDFYYSSRFRRFHTPYYGYGYYDPWFSDMYYYTYDPFFWGTSIYFGTYWGGFGFYNYYSPFSYYRWGYPYSYYGSYYAGYYDGYWGSHYYNGDYYNNYGRGSYYGHRSSRSSISPYGSSRSDGLSARKTSNSYDPVYRASGRYSESSRTVSASEQRSSNVRSDSRSQEISRSSSQTGTRSAETTTRSAESRTYVRPSSRDYTPSYTKPRTTTSPGYNRSTSTYKSSSAESTGSDRNSNTYTRPSSTSRSSGSATYSRPSAVPQNNNSRTSSSSAVSSPSSGTSGYSAPSRSYSSPSRSYSAPSRSYSAPSSSGSRSSSSSSSYSAPSRSSSAPSSSSSSRSSGSSSGSSSRSSSSSRR